MNRNHLTVFLGILVLFAVGCLFALATGRMNQVVSFLLLFFMYAGPAFAGEEAFDIIDKVIDRKFLPEKQLSSAIHAFAAVLLGICIWAIWPTLAIALNTSAELEVGRWLNYMRIPDLTPTSLGYPQYAWDMGLWALITFMAAYAFEPILLNWVARRKNRKNSTSNI